MLNKIIYTFLGIGLALVFYPHVAKDSTKKALVSGIHTEVNVAETKPAPEMAINLSPPVLSTHAALGYDLDSNTMLYSKNLDEPLPIASLTKLMTAIIVVKNMNLDAVVEVDKNKIRGVVGNVMGLVGGEQIRVDDLLQGMLIASSNDSALILADFVGGSEDRFVKLMNSEATTLGLTATHFSNPVGWDLGENYSSTLDLIKIVKEFLKSPVLAQIVKTKYASIVSIDGKYQHELTTTNKLLLEDPDVLGIKTGFTSKALGNLIILKNFEGRQIVTIVLGSDYREEDTEKLLDWLLKVYRW